MGVYRHVLLATDCSAHSEKVAQVAAVTAQCHEAALTLIHVLEHFPEDIPVENIAPENVDPEQFLVGRARQALTDLARRIGREDAGQVVRISTRSAKAEIVQYVTENDIDLVVLGSDTRPGVAGLIGNTVSGVLNSASCDVLTVRIRR
jgi:universal stress protein A